MNAQTPKHPTGRFEHWLCVLAPALLAMGLGFPRLFGERWMADTPYYQAISMQAARTGEWWSLQQGSLPYFNKPPLSFWAYAMCVRLFGEVDWAYRLPDLIWYVLTCMLIADLARRVWDVRIGLCAGLAMACTGDWYWRVANFRLEYLMTCMLVAAMWCWVRGLVPACAADSPCADDVLNGRPARSTEYPGVPPVSDTDCSGVPGRTCGTACTPWAVAAGVCVGLALLVKPMIAFGIIPLMAAWLVLLGSLHRRTIGMLAVSLLVALAVALPWHVSMSARHGHAFTSAYFVNQAYKRAIGEAFDAEPWYWYFHHVVDVKRVDVGPQGMWPIYGLAIAGIVLIVARRFPVHRRTGDVLALLYTGGWILALCVFSDKRPYYLMAVHPGTALLAGRFAGSVVPGAITRWLGVAAAGLGVALTVRTAVHVSDIRTAAPLASERAALMEFVKTHPKETYYDCGLVYQDAALVYIHTGVWPRTLLEKVHAERKDVPPGSLMVYSSGGVDAKGRRAEVDPTDEVLLKAKGDPPRGNVDGREYVIVRRR